MVDGLFFGATPTGRRGPQRSGEALERSQGRLEALLPSHRWIRWEIAISGQIKYWEGIPGFFESLLSAAKQCRLSHVTVGRKCAHAGTKSARPSIAASSKPQWGLPSIEPLVPTISSRTEESGAMGGSCQFHRLLALQPQGMENHYQTLWQVWTLLSPVPRLGKLHRLATREERGTQDRGSRVHQAGQQGAVRSKEDSNTWGSQ